MTLMEKPWGEQVRAARDLIPKMFGKPRWTQVQMAQAMGVSPNTIAMWERGEREASPQSERMLAYCYALALRRIDPRTV